MPRYHDRDYFFKYVTKDVAKLIIKNHTLRWSCPVDFNDPFDHKFAFFDESRLEAIFRLLVERFETYVWERDDIQFDEANPLGLILAHFKNKKDAIPRETYRTNVETIKQQSIESGQHALAEFNEETRRALLQTRGLCLTEENDNLLMWSHYSASHTGAVFKLNAIDELDVPLLVAKKVRYSREYPVLVTEEEWVDHALYINRIDMGKREGELLLVKGEDWHYEREWRISITDEGYPLGGTIDFEEPPPVFGAIYLGCRMPDEDKKEIRELADKNLPEMEIWQAIQGQKAYKIEFEKLK
jgi:hypothetical protein